MRFARSGVNGIMRDSIVGRLARVPLVRTPPGVDLVIITLLAAGATVLRAGLAPVLPPGFPFLTYFPVVIASAFLFGTRAGTFAAVICGVLSWYYFVPPARSFALDAGASLALGFYALIVAVDVLLIHLAQRVAVVAMQDREHARRLAESHELLFRELQHRVSNNLQVLGSLLALQKRGLSDPAAVSALEQAANRLHLIGRIQRQLYDMSGTRVGLAALLGELARGTLEAAGRDDIRLEVDAAGDEMLDPDATLPVALIVVEAVSNAIEHGLPGRSGSIRLTLARRSAGELVVTVADDGLGLPAGFRLDKADSLGLRLARNLTRQLKAQFSLEPGGLEPGGSGATARLVLPSPA